jgi:hypothetical protein
MNARTVQGLLAGLKRRLRPSSGEIPLAFAQAVTNRIVSSDARTTIAVMVDDDVT